MAYARLESNLAKVKKDLTNFRSVNDNFCSILDELNNIKTKSISDPKIKESIAKEFKEKAIIDLFSSIEKDFNELKNQLNKQELYRERVSDFVESLRTRKSFSFNETTKTILFLESAIDTLESDYVSIKPQFIGTVDFGELAIKFGLHKNDLGVVLQKELLGEVLGFLISKRMFRNLIFETDNAKLILASSNELIIESDNTNIRKISRIEVE